jgi:hypothetical protein
VYVRAVVFFGVRSEAVARQRSNIRWCLQSRFPGTCLPSRGLVKFYVFLFLSSGKSYIVVVNFVAAVTCLPSIYLKTTASSGPTIFRVDSGTCVCVCVFC